MSDQPSPWVWCNVRRQYFCWSAVEQLFVYQDGIRTAALPQPDAAPAAPSIAVHHTAHSAVYPSSVGEGSAIIDESVSSATARPKRGETAYALNNWTASHYPSTSASCLAEQPRRGRKRKISGLIEVSEGLDHRTFSLAGQVVAFFDAQQVSASEERVFKALWAQPRGFNPADHGHSGARVSFDGAIHKKVSPFIVIRASKEFSICLRIHSHGESGVSKPHHTKHHHSIIYSGHDEPRPAAAEIPTRHGERGLLPSIRIKVRSQDDRLSNMSRINYAKPYTVEHNVKVYELGSIRDESVRTLERNYKAIRAEIENHHYESSSETSEASEAEEYSNPVYCSPSQAAAVQPVAQTVPEQYQHDERNRYLLQFYAGYLVQIGDLDRARHLLQATVEVQLQICMQLMQQGIMPPGE